MLPLLKTHKTLSLFHQEFRDKELFSNTPTSPVPYQLHLPDGPLVLWQIKIQKYSRSHVFLLSLTQSVTNKQSLKPLTSISPVLLSVILIHLSTTLMFQSPAQTDLPSQLPWFIGCWPEKLKSLEDNLTRTRNGMN